MHSVWFSASLSGGKRKKSNQMLVATTYGIHWYTVLKHLKTNSLASCITGWLVASMPSHGTINGRWIQRKNSCCVDRWRLEAGWWGGYWKQLTFRSAICFGICSCRCLKFWIKSHANSLQDLADTRNLVGFKSKFACQVFWQGTFYKKETNQCRLSSGCLSSANLAVLLVDGSWLRWAVKLSIKLLMITYWIRMRSMRYL